MNTEFKRNAYDPCPKNTNAHQSRTKYNYWCSNPQPHATDLPLSFNSVSPLNHYQTIPVYYTYFP
jgi:hypothetical protein